MYAYFTDNFKTVSYGIAVGVIHISLFISKQYKIDGNVIQYLDLVWCTKTFAICGKH